MNVYLLYNSTMDNQKIYDQIINSAFARKPNEGEYYERHHIIPRSMGGGDEAENIAVLTAREYYICHWLLYRIHRSKEMASAWYFMQYHSSGLRYVSRTFEYARKYRSLHLTGSKLSEDHKKNISAAGMGRIGGDIQKAAAASNNKSRVWTAEMRAKASAARVGKFVRGSHQRALPVKLLETGQEFDCMTDAAEYLGVTVAAVKNSITRKGKCKGFTIRYL